ncbi:MAG: binding-protein-dependent transport system inner rane component [Dactylosporangium sp.]|nr:binding-protein-dependent transport system inner rane component [Dactylosporangium sp.]
MTRRRRSVAGIVGVTIVAGTALFTVLAPLIAPAGPDDQDLARILQPPSWSGNLLGTDRLGRDVLTRVLYGGREALLITVLAVLISVAVGVGLGFVAGLAGRWVDNLIGRLADIQLAIPSVLLALVVLAFAGGGTVPLVVVLTVGSWVLNFRVVRTHAAATAAQPFIEAARLAGAGTTQVIRRHILPATLPLVAVSITLNFSAVLLLESSLGFLGLGVQPPTPDWGQMVASGQAQLASAWWVSLAPGLALITVIVGVQLVGDWLAERFSVADLVKR